MIVIVVFANSMAERVTKEDSSDSIMDNALANEQGNECNKSPKLQFNFDVPKIDSQDEYNISSHNSSSSSSSDLLAPGSEDIDKDVEFSLQPNQGGPYSEDSNFSPNLSPKLPLWSPPNLSPMQSPMVQALARPNGYDPNRLPARIFSSKPSTPMEWSTASNESLFSLHLGNTSFSRDQFLMFYRSGELTKLDEVMTNAPPPFPCANNGSSYSSSSSKNAEIKSVSSESEPSETASSNSKWSSTCVHGGEKNMMRHDFDENRRMGHNKSNSLLSYRSDDSYNSTCSFQFPV